MYVLIPLCLCVCITEHKTGNAELASADSRGSTEISSVTPERETHTHVQSHGKQILDSEVRGNSRLRQTQTR